MNQTLNSVLQINAYVENLLNGALTRSSFAADIDAQNREAKINRAAGYPEVVTTADYYDKWKRLGIARRIIRAYPKACWQVPPTVYETEDPDNETEFENEFTAVDKRVGLLSALASADVLCGIGRFGVVLIGYDDGKELDQPVDGFIEDPFEDHPGKEGTPTLKLNYVRPLSEQFATVAEVDNDKRSPRLGLPTMYRLHLGHETGQGGTQAQAATGQHDVKVHWHRVIHITEVTDESAVYAAPRLECVYNDLLDFKKISSASPEGYFQSSSPTLSFKLDPGFDGVDEASISRQLKEVAEGMRKYISAVGVTVSSIAPQIEDPTPHFNVKLTAISIATEIPQRILMGTEEGRLAGDQDGDSWDDNVTERQQNHVIPNIVKKAVQHLQRAGVLRKVKDEVMVDWDSAHEMGAAQSAEIAERVTNALAKYAAGRVETVIPLADFLHLVMKFPLDEVEAIVANLEANPPGPDEDQIQAALEAQAAAAGQALPGGKPGAAQQAGSGKAQPAATGSPAAGGTT